MKRTSLSSRRRGCYGPGRWQLAGGVFAVLALVLAGCGGSSSGESGDATEVPEVPAGADPLEPQPLEERATITVGLSSKLEVYLPILLGQEFGEFDKESLDIKIEYLPPSDSALLLTQGDLDIVYSSFTAGMLNLISRNEGLRFAYPGPVNQSPDQGVYATKATFSGPGEHDASDFKGAKFMASSGSAGSSAFFIYKYAQGLPGGDDLKPTDITFESVQLPEVPLVLKSGAADGGQVISPYHTELTGEDCCFVLDGAYPDRPQTGYVVGPSMSERKDAAMAFFRVLARTEKTYLQDNYHDDPEVLSAMAKTMEQSEEALVKGRPLRFDPALETNTEILSELQPFYRAFGDISYPEDMPAEAIYDTSYLKRLGAAD